MLIVYVFIEVKPEFVDEFVDATLANASASVKEPGIARFDVLQDLDDPTKFVLNEVYRSAEAPAAHKETAHYLRWKDTVADMIVSPRTKRVFHNLFSADEEWA